MLKHTVVLFCACLVHFAVLAIDESFRREWDAYKNTFDKKYSDRNHEERSFAVWKNNFLAIKYHNEKYEKKLVTFKLKMMKYGDSLKLDQYIPVGRKDRLIETESSTLTTTSTKQPTIRTTSFQIVINTKAANKSYKDFKIFLAKKFSLNH